MKLGVIIAAGGSGRRMEADCSKQLMELDGVPVVVRSIAIFNNLEPVRQIVVAIEAKDIPIIEKLIKQNKFDKISAVVEGGSQRAISVLNAFRALGKDIDTVAVHDGARPLFPAMLLQNGLSQLRDDATLDGVVFGIPVTDTVKQTRPGSALVASSPERAHLWQAQTPQIFRRTALDKAFNASQRDLAGATDDASLVEKNGGKVKMIEGSPENIKITRSADIAAALDILSRRRRSWAQEMDAGSQNLSQ